MKSAFNRSGGIGLGAGAGSQGTQYAGVDVSKTVGGSAESGMGKIMVEMGVPGILAAITLLVLVSRRILKNMKWVAKMSTQHLIHQISFTAFMFANVMTFTVATGIYGDLFILILIGTVGGFIVQINEKAIRYAIFQTRRKEESQLISPNQATVRGATPAVRR